jgi:hypothetical protein
MASLSEIKQSLLELVSDDARRAAFVELVGAHDFGGVGEFLQSAFPDLSEAQVLEIAQPSRCVALADALLHIHRWAKRAAVSLYAARPEYGAAWPDQALPLVATSWSANGRNPAIELLVQAIDGLRPVAEVREELLALDSRISHEDLERLVDGLG